MRAFMRFVRHPTRFSLRAKLITRPSEKK